MNFAKHHALYCLTCLCFSLPALAGTIAITGGTLVREGRRADVLVLKNDPRVAIEAVEQIDSVIAQGVVIDRAALLDWTIPADHPKINEK